MLYLAENIRRLRRARDLTQEEFARKINISAKSVSKWERGDGYPDIELLPALAAIFECSVDDLLGMDKLRDEQLISNRINELQGENDGPFDMFKNPDKYIPVLRDLRRTYPNNINIMSNLVECYRLKEIYAEAIPLLERILELDPIDGGANYRARLTYCYAFTGRVEDAREMSYKLTSIGHSTELVWGRAMKGKGKDEFEAWQNAALRLESGFDDVFNGMVLCDYLTTEKKIALLEQYNMLIGVLYGMNYAYKLYYIADNCHRIAELAVEIGDTSKALDALEEMAEYAVMYDKGIEKGEILHGAFTSPVFDGVTYNNGIQDNLSRYLLHDDEENSAFRLLHTSKGVFHPIESNYWDTLKTQPRFQAVADKLSTNT
jgi:transcriptional regulator with XRE-family HTH domain